jgi:hypothetical protein
MRRAIWLALALAAAPVNAWACRCTETSPRYSYDTADAVAVVRIEEVAVLADGALRAKATVVQTWKSALPGSIQVFTGDDCAYPLDRGGTHLLYLRRSKSGELGTYRCWGNRPEGDAARSLQWLATNGRRAAVTAQ